MSNDDSEQSAYSMEWCPLVIWLDWLQLTPHLQHIVMAHEKIDEASTSTLASKKNSLVFMSNIIEYTIKNCIHVARSIC